MEEIKLKKTWKNSSGNIEVRAIKNCGIVEIMHLYSKNKSGCVIGYWEKRKCDGYPIAEFKSCGSRIMETEYDNPDILLQVLKFGQSLADVIVEVEKEDEDSNA